MDQQSPPPADADEILAGAQDAVLRIGNRPLIIEASFVTWFDLIAIVQVALRHPGMKDQAPAQRTEKFIRNLIEKVDPDHGELWRLLNMGFDPKYDR